MSHKYSVFWEASRHNNDAHDADTKPSTHPTRCPVRKLARESKSASAARLTRPTRLTRARPSSASPTTWSSLTFSDLIMAITTTPASLADAQDAIPGLLDDIVVTHVLRSEHFDDPADLARLPAVSRAMRDLVAETGLRFKELDEKRAVELGCVSAVQRMQRQGRLSRQERLCQAAARSGQLEELKALRADSWPWDRDTCSAAALGGHLEVLQWAHANGCLWDIRTCHKAAEGGYLKVILWARANGCPCAENEL